jgi:stromal membrane-associated protein
VSPHSSSSSPPLTLLKSIRVTGNRNSNARYNPKDVEAPVNLHDSERDSELEKFIRNKYQYCKFMNIRDGSDSHSGSSSRGPESGRIEAGRSKARELLNPPVRSSSVAQPRVASPALTTKSPAPITTSSPTPPTPSPSLPAPATQTLQRSPQPPLQMLSPSPQPPLQMLSPSPSIPMMPSQQGMMPMSTGMPTYQSAMYTGMSPPVNLPNTNPVWQDMAAIQTGPALPALPSFQQQPLNAMSYHQAMATSTMPMQGMAAGWVNTNQMAASPTPMNMMATSPMSASYQLSPSQQFSMGGMSPIQAQYTQAQSSFGMQQQLYQQPQPIYVSNGVVVQQPQMMPNQGANPHMWTQGGYATQGQWQG